MVTKTGASIGERLEYDKRALCIVGIVLLLALSSAIFMSFSFVRQARGASSVSPLLWGDNLELNGNTPGSDWFLGSTAVQSGETAIHTQIVRMPVRGGGSSASGFTNLTDFETAVQNAKALGMVPLVILRCPSEPDALVDDSTIVDYMNTEYPSTSNVVYYEWGNETDLSSSNCYIKDPATYASEWNAVVPHLKAIAVNDAKFIGPVNYQYDASYLQTFLQDASPLPDAISWHEYTCPSTTSSSALASDESACLADIDHWTTHITAARTLMTNTIGEELPIWITEWNFNPNLGTASASCSPIVDLKYSDATFQYNWTQKALQVLAANGVAASMHYNVCDDLPLVTNVATSTTSYTVTSEGQAFSDEYTALVTDSTGITPTATPTTGTTPTVTPTTTPTSVQYSFEDGTLDGWSSSGNVTSLTNSTAVGGQNGTHALQVVFNSGSNSWPYIHVNPSSGPTAGEELTAFVYAPDADTGTISAKLYVQDPSYTWHTANAVVLGQSDSWIELSFSPTGYSGNALQVGLQFYVSPNSTSSTLYVDSVNWTTSSATAPMYSFEDGTLDSWSSTGNVTSLTNSTAVGGQDGTHALKAIFSSTSSTSWPYIHVNPSSGPTAGQAITADVYVPDTDTTTISAQLYVEDASYNWYIATPVVVSQRDNWAELSFTPTGYSGAAIQVGLQFYETPNNTATTLYVDSVNWA